MAAYVVLLRAINVGGKNRLPMAALAEYLAAAGCEDIATYAQTGNAVLRSSLAAAALEDKLLRALPARFGLDDGFKVAVLSAQAYRRVIADAPDAFGPDTAVHRHYVLVPIGVSPAEVTAELTPREGIDTVWQGSEAVYVRFPAAGNPDYAKSGFRAFVASPLYRKVTIRNWKTTQAIGALADGLRAAR